MPCRRAQPTSTTSGTTPSVQFNLSSSIPPEGCSLPFYDRALHALRSWLDSWAGIWVITEADRSVTTILLPEEYRKSDRPPRLRPRWRILAENIQPSVSVRAPGPLKGVVECHLTAANDLLKQDITRPLRRLSYVPLVRGKAEHHLGELIPRVGPPLTAASSSQARCGRRLLSGPS